MTAALLFQVEFLQFYAYCFETLQMFWSWSENVHIFWILCSDYFLLLFHKFSLVAF